MPDTDLTPRQTEILRLIQRTVQETGMPPTRKEIADELGFRSPNAAEDHLRALARKGVITLLPGSSRGIQLKDCLPRTAGPAAHRPRGRRQSHPRRRKHRGSSCRSILRSSIRSRITC